MSDCLRWGLSLGPAGLPVLRQLLAADLIDRIALPPPNPGDPTPSPQPQDGPETADQETGKQQRADQETTAAKLLAEEWSRSRAFVAVGACGAITRLIAPHLGHKVSDPAVVVIDPAGRHAIPLLGGHGAGADGLCQEIAALLGGVAVLTGGSGSRGRLALDKFGEAWGWRRGGGDWDALMKAASRDQPIAVGLEAGNQRWCGLAAAAALPLELSVRQDAGDHGEPEGHPEPPGASHANPQLLVSSQQGPGCRWHPPVLWLGMGCERNTSTTLVQRAIASALASEGLAPEAVAGMASVDRKADEPALLELCRSMDWPLRVLTAEQLAAVAVPNPSPVVAATMGTASVAEAAALLAAGPGGRLRLQKRIERPLPGEQGAATVAIGEAQGQWAPSRGHLHLVGSGPGRLDLLTPDANRALAQSTVWVGYGLYLDLLEPLRRPDQLRSDGRLTEERERCREALDLACQGVGVALVSSGDSGIYGMAGLALEQWMALAPQDRPGFSVHPGISAVQLAAARAGAPLMHDFCTVSLSDRLTPWEVIERRLKAAATGDFVVALYNPRSQGRDWQLGRARELLLAERPASTPVVLARQLGRPEEEVSLHALGDLPLERVDMLTLVLVGNSTSRVSGGRMVTPRGYPGAALS